MIASRPLRVRCGIGLPHVLQNAVAKLRAWGRSKRATEASPRNHRKAEALTITSQECAVPVAFRHREQWQEEVIERSLDLERDLAAEAAPPECRHHHLLESTARAHRRRAH